MADSTGLALTTVFTPPATCTDIITQSKYLFWQGGVEQTGDPDCYPPGFTNIFDSAYSPGICPYGWTAGGTPTPAPATGTAARRDALPQEETPSGSPGSSPATPSPSATPTPTNSAAWCCPSGYRLTSNLPVIGPTNGFYFCASPMPATMTNVYQTSALADGPLPPNPSTTTLAAATLPYKEVWADVILVAWQSTDTEILSLMASVTSAEAAAAAASKTSHSSSTPSASANGSGAHKSSGGGLSGGAIAGIAIGAVAALAIIGAAFFWYRRRKRVSTSGSAPATTENKTWDHVRYHEAPAESHAVELQGDNRHGIHELGS